MPITYLLNDYSSKSYTNLPIDYLRWTTVLFKSNATNTIGTVLAYVTNCHNRWHLTEFKCEDYVKLNLKKCERSVLCHFRTGILPLRVETGRYVG